MKKTLAIDVLNTPSGGSKTQIINIMDDFVRDDGL